MARSRRYRPTIAEAEELFDMYVLLLINSGAGSKFGCECCRHLDDAKDVYEKLLPKMRPHVIEARKKRREQEQEEGPA